MRWFKASAPESANEAIEWSVRRALYGDPRLRDFDAPRIRIVVGRGGEVVLAGAVSGSEARALAERVARRANGVAGLRNDLRTDADVTAQLRSMLASDPRTRSLATDSVVFHGMAELRGGATSDGQLAALEMAEALDGVRGVDNYMRLAASGQTADTYGAA